MDIDILLILQKFRTSSTGIFDSFFLYVTTLGEDFVLMLWIGAFYWCIEKKTGIYLLLNFHMANFVNQLSKITACVYRPWVRDGRILPLEAAKPAATGYSFPSGHTAKAEAIWGGIGFRSAGNRSLRRFMWLIVFAVAFSRIYLGVHTPQDVMVSLMIGYVILRLTSHLLDWVEEKKNRDIVLCLGGLLLSAGLLLYANNKPYPMDYVNGELLVNPASMINGAFRGAGGMAGFMLGWLWERRNINFHEKCGTLEEKILRLLIGILGLLIVIRIIPYLVNRIVDVRIAAFANGFLLAFYITGLYPWFIKRKELLKDVKAEQ